MAQLVKISAHISRRPSWRRTDFGATGRGHVVFYDGRLFTKNQNEKGRIVKKAAVLGIAGANLAKTMKTDYRCAGR